MVDFLKPVDSKIDTKIINADAKKSKYDAKKLTCIGTNFWKKCDIRLSISSSMYPLRPRATLDVAVKLNEKINANHSNITKKNTRSQSKPHTNNVLKN